jgi:hypothetical protein
MYSRPPCRPLIVSSRPLGRAHDGDLAVGILKLLGGGGRLGEFDVMPDRQDVGKIDSTLLKWVACGPRIG